MKTSVAILAGGLATRLRPITEKYPKAMIDIHGKPFIEYQFALLAGHGLTDIVLCLGYEGKQIEDYFGDGHRFGVNLRYSYDGDVLLGTGGAIQKALPLLSDVFIVLYGDSYLKADYPSIVSHFLTFYTPDASDSPIGLMTVYKNDNQFDTSNVIFQEEKIIKYDKRNPLPEMEYIDWGLGILTKTAFESFNGKFDLADLYEFLVDQKKLMGYEVFQRFYEIGSFDGLNEFKKLVQQGSLGSF